MIADGQSRPENRGLSGPHQGSQSQRPPVVLFFTDNGRGLGHLTRLLAVAQHAAGRFRPVFLTMSLGYQLLRHAQVPAEFFPAYHQLGLSKSDWSPLLSMRISEMIDQTQARAVVVDHVTPPSTFRELRSSTSGVEFIWSRRGLWREGKNQDALRLSSGFDSVVEPGDLATPIDVGASGAHRSQVSPIEPIVLVRPDQMLTRGDARRALGMPSNGRAVLLNLSAPDTDALVHLLEMATHAIRSAAGEEPIQVFAPLHPLHSERLTSVEGVTFAPVYPVARFFRAFDGAISTAGYNSFHEIVASGLPAIFVAHSQTNVDDQERRARFAELCGRGFWAESVDDESFRLAVRRMLRKEEPEIAAEVTRILGEMRGAAEFADIIAESVERAEAQSLHIPTLEPGERDRRSIPSKISAGEGTGGVMLILASEHTSDELNDLATELAWLRDSEQGFTPLLLIGEGSPRPLVERGFAFESLMGLERWSQLETTTDYEAYVGARVEGAKSRYGTDWVAVARPGHRLGPAVESGLRARKDRNRELIGEGLDARSFRLALPSLAGDRRGSLDVVLPSHLYVPRLLEADGLAGYEPSSLACWLTILAGNNSGAAFDVGANVGPYAWLAAALTDRDVIAFEPVPDLANALRSVAEANRLEIAVEAVALSDRGGSATLYLSDQTDSSNSLLEGFRRSSRSIEVAVRTVDSYVDETGVVPHAVKIDTETTEPDVLLGARKTLLSHRPWLIVEVLAHRSEGRLMEALDSLDYHWYRIDDELPFERASEIVGDPTHENMNWLFAPSEPEDELWDGMRAWREALRSCTPRPSNC